ncbi:hypothetical protein SAMN05444955_11342 [Lihuaxuella thermophila]|uniref:Uncharacterized protein n=1 Tax=Lihuaxuella thermophila TaxID=1173111 RepID=A0A1H8H683_9BACL|nr:hypothetical protein SAMN05444955_11342 [Lihuaxuella thermophila]
MILFIGEGQKGTIKEENNGQHQSRIHRPADYMR